MFFVGRLAISIGLASVETVEKPACNFSIGFG